MIIECKCKKYKFKIPQQEIISPGRDVVCEMCNEEWYEEFLVSENISNKYQKSNLDFLDKINPSKIKINMNLKKDKTESSLLLYTLIFFVIIFIIYKLTLNFKIQILNFNPELINFYESLEIIIEIISAYFIFLKVLLSETFTNL